MPTTDITIRAGSNTAIDMTLLTDGTGSGIADTPINLSGANHAEFFMISRDTGGTSTFSTTGAKATILPGTLGKVQFIPDGTIDMPLRSNGSSNLFECFWWVFTTSTKKYSVPEDFNFTITVKA